MSSVLRSGRLAGNRGDVVDFISSVREDKRIALSTIFVNEAHVIGLVKAKAMNRRDARRILNALRELETREIPVDGVEDIHVAIEKYVTRRTGRKIGGQLHLGKSRNDQVATAIRMTLRDDLLKLSGLLISFELVILGLARKHVHSVFPGYTHLQPAQPISFTHYLLANGDSILRDNERLMEALTRINKSPMGSGALAGTSVNLDRTFVGRLLGFDGILEVSLDAVGSRDFVLEALSVCALTALDISRMAQDLIFYSSADVGLLTVPDEFASTSSIMPQKKNPDPLEVIRARCAKVMSNFNSAVVTMHALPSGYNLDFQEITSLAWQSIDPLVSCVRILIELLPRVGLDKAIAERQHLQWTAAAEIANILAREEKLPFRKAHHVVGIAVRKALEKGRTLAKLTPLDWGAITGKALTKKTRALIIQALDLQQHLYLYRTRGSPNPNEMKRIIAERRHRSKVLLRDNARMLARWNKALKELHASSKKI